MVFDQKAYYVTHRRELIKARHERYCKKQREKLKKALDEISKWGLPLKEKGYIAGLIDGEGSISILKGKSNVTGHMVFCVKISIGNTCLEALEYCKNVIGFGAIYHMSLTGKLGKKPQYSYQIQGMLNCYKFLRVIAPCLIIKRRRAQLTLKLLEIWIKEGERRGYFARRRPVQEEGTGKILGTTGSEYSSQIIKVYEEIVNESV